MPKHTKVITIEITVEQFLDNCSDSELKELDLLIQSPRYQNRINLAPKDHKKQTQPAEKNTELQKRPAEKNLTL
jgi:hypothetical protein